MSYTRAQWAQSLLAAIGNSNPTPYTLNWLICWTQFETAWPNAASFNLLNTTQPESGSTGGGSQGNIQFYADYNSGIMGNAVTLKNGNYPTILQALQFNDEATLAAAASTRISNELGTWGTGHASSIANCASSGGSQGAQAFSGTPGTGVIASTLSNPTSATIATGTDPLSSFIQGLAPMLAWLQDPARLFKLIGGLLLIGISLMMLIAPEQIDKAKNFIKNNPELLAA